MRTGKYEASDGGNTAGTAVTFLLIGLGAGTLLGMLLAPKAGKQMRKDLRKKFDSARETVDEWTDDAKEFAEDAMERGADFADQVKGRVAPLAKAMRYSKVVVSSQADTGEGARPPLALLRPEVRGLTSAVRRPYLKMDEKKPLTLPMTLLLG